MADVLQWISSTNSLSVSGSSGITPVIGQGIDNNFSVTQTFQAGIRASGSTSLQAVSGTTGNFTGAVAVSGFTNAGDTTLQAVSGTTGTFTGAVAVSGFTTFGAEINQTASAGAQNQSPLLNTADVFSDFIASGVTWGVPSPASLTSAMASGVATLNGTRTIVPAVSSYPFPASNDTYISFNNAGVPAYQSVANGAAAPTPESGYVQTAKVVTNPIQSPYPNLTAATSGSLASGTYQVALVAHDVTGYGAVGGSASVSVAASGSIDISWANPLNETSMDIYATTAGGTTLGLVASGVTGTGYTYTGSPAPGAAAPTTATSNAIQKVVPLLGFGPHSNSVNLDYFLSQYNNNFQQAMLAAMAYIVSVGGGEIFIDSGVYNATGTLQTGNGQNSVIPLPYVPYFEQPVTIKISGKVTQYAYPENTTAQPVPINGVIIQSSVTPETNNGLNPSIMGFASSITENAPWSSWTNINLEIENITFRNQPNSGLMALNLTNVANVRLKNTTADINATTGGFSAPTLDTFIGIELPNARNYGAVYCENVYILGYYYGLQHASHAILNGVFIQNCVGAIYIPTPYNHAAFYTSVLTQGCEYSIYCTAVPNVDFATGNIVVGNLDIEHDSSFAMVNDVYVTSGSQLNGSLNFNIVQPGLAYPNLSVGGTGIFNCKTFNLGLNQGQGENGGSCIFTTGGTILSSQVSAFYEYTGTGSGITIPTPSSVAAGQKLTIWNNTSDTVEINTTSGHIVVPGAASEVANIYLQPNQTIHFRYDGYNCIAILTSLFRPSVTINGPTAGTVLFRRAIDGSSVIFTFSGYENNTTTAQTINFPEAFTESPIVVGNNTGLTLTTSAGGVTITAPDSTTTYSGTAVIMGN